MILGFNFIRGEVSKDVMNGYWVGGDSVVRFYIVRLVIRVEVLNAGCI